MRPEFTVAVVGHRRTVGGWCCTAFCILRHSSTLLSDWRLLLTPV